MIVKDWCSYCGECSGVCPRDCIEVREYNLVFSQDCNDCGICGNHDRQEVRNRFS